MDKTDSTLIDAPLLDEVVGTGPELGDITQLKAEDAPELGDLSSVEEPPILGADEAIPVLSELITPAAPQAAPQGVTSGLAEPDSGLRSFLDSSLEIAANQETEDPAPAEPLSNALDELLGDLPGDDLEASDELTDEAPATEAVETATASGLTADEPPPASTTVEPEAVSTEILDQPLEVPNTESEDGDPLGDALDALLGEDDGNALVSGEEGEATAPASALAEAEPASALATEAAEEAGPSPDEAPLDLLGAGATAATGAAVLPALRARLQEHLTHRVDDILSETVAVLVQELESQIVERVEGVLMESLEAALPKLMDGFVEGLREELQPRLRAQIPALMEDILGREGAGEKNA